MTDRKTPPRKMRKLIIQLVTGMLTGMIVTLGALKFLDGRGFDTHDPSRMLALAIGLLFAIIGGFVAFGLAAPKAGSQLLNVQDADELSEQGATLRQGSAVYVLGGLGLLALAIGGEAGEGHLLSANGSALIAAAAFAAAAIVGYRSRNTADEMMRALSREASVLSLSVITILAIAWAILAQLGRAPGLTSLGVLAALLGIQLLAVMIVVGRRGMLTPR